MSMRLPGSYSRQMEPAALVMIKLRAPRALSRRMGTVTSILVLVYLLRRDVGRVFELGEGPATLPEEEARKVEEVIGRRG